jgi:hypothetical protein
MSSFPSSRWAAVWSRAALLLAAHLICVALWAQAPKPGQGSSRPDEQKKEAADEGRVQPNLPVFEFHSNFWINLHHFLYDLGRAARPGTTADSTDAPTRRASVPAKIDAALTAEETRQWQESVQFYAGSLASRDLLFNSELVAIKTRLVDMEGAPDLKASGLRPDLVAALERAAPIYRAHWWPQHDRGNRAWVAAVAPLVENLGGGLSRRLAEVYQASWPEGRIRVDVSYYANWAGAYTTLEPLHTVISSSDPGYQGFAAFEMLFHEASHGLAGAVRDGITRECRTRNRPIPRDLWHAVIFYTTGEMVRRTLGAADVGQEQGPPGSRPATSYTPYAYRQGLYERGWEGYVRVLERFWRQYLDGQVDFDRAIARMVANL